MGISKRGSQHLRSLLVHGARAVVRTAPSKTDPNNEWVNQLRERARLQPRNGRCRQQERTEYLGRASNWRAVLRAAFRRPATDRETKLTAQVGPARNEPDFIEALVA